MDEPAAARPKFSPQAIVEVALILLVFIAQAGWPVPDPNEAHYLAKIKKAWDPQWLEGDFFLESPDPHVVFTMLFGWPTKFLSLPVYAWCGRLLTWTLLAWGWRRLSYSLVRRPWMSVLTASLFVMLQERCQMAGEWVVGGFESKGIAYALVLFALEALVKNEWKRVWLTLGAASAVHVLVGGWTAIAAAFAWLVVGRRTMPLNQMLPALFGGAVWGCLGLWPALKLSLFVPWEIVTEANEIYVYERLPHHLVFGEFFPERPSQIAMHFLMIAAWFAIGPLLAPDGGTRRFRAVVLATILMSVVGVCLDFATAGDHAVGAMLLKYYWFRMADALVPMGLAIGVVQLLIQYRIARPTVFRVGLAVATIVAAVYLVGQGRKTLGADRPRADKSQRLAEQTGAYGDWLKVCSWIRENTPERARFLTPRRQQTFKWYADRSEIATWKDMPQDPRGIVEWWHRMEDIYRNPDVTSEETWLDSLGNLNTGELRKLAATYDAQYLVTEKPDRTLPLQRVYPPPDETSSAESSVYQVYKLPQ